MKRPATSSDAVALLLRRVPELEPLNTEHLADFGELLPYPLVEGDFMRWFFNHVRTDGDPALTQRFLGAMDEVLDTGSDPKGKDSASNLGMIALVEPLSYEENEDVLEKVLPLLPAATRRCLRHELRHAPH